MSTSCANEGTSQGNQSSNHQYSNGCPVLKKVRGSPQTLSFPPPPAACCRKNTVTDKTKELTEEKKKESRIYEIRSLGYSINVGGHLYVWRTPSEEELYAKIMKKFDTISKVWPKDLDQVTSENDPNTTGDDTEAPDYDAETSYDEEETTYDDAEIPDDDADILHDDQDTSNKDLETPDDNPETLDDYPDSPKHDSDAPVADIPMVYHKQIGFYDSEDSLDEVELNNDEDSSRSASPIDSIGSPDAADQRSIDRSDALKPNALPLLAHTWNTRTVCPQCGRKLKLPTPSKVQ